MRTRHFVCLASALIALAAFPAAAENKTDKAKNYVDNIRLPDPPKESTGTVKQSTTPIHASEIHPPAKPTLKIKEPPPPAKPEKK